jgi:hypothetical protein
MTTFLDVGLTDPARPAPLGKTATQAVVNSLGNARLGAVEFTGLVVYRAFGLMGEIRRPQDSSALHPGAVRSSVR